MYSTKLGRRGALAAGFAAAFIAAPDTAAREANGTAGALLTEEKQELIEAAARHAPFRAAFLEWLGDASGRCVLPVSACTTSPSQTTLRVPGLHWALKVVLSGDTQINVFATWNNEWWDIVASMDVYAEPMPDGTGWRNELLIPEAKLVRPTQEACWREDGFEWVLTWLNEELAQATHLALFGGEGCYEGRGWTSAHLARDGLLIPSGRTIESNGPLLELLPLFPAGVQSGVPCEAAINEEQGMVSEAPSGLVFGRTETQLIVGAAGASDPAADTTVTEASSSGASGSKSVRSFGPLRDSISTCRRCRDLAASFVKGVNEATTPDAHGRVGVAFQPVL